MARGNIDSFLIINPFGIGDVLFSTPLIRELRDNFPDSRIHYLCNRRNSFLLRNHPCVDSVFEFEHSDFEREKRRSFWHGIRKYGSFINTIRKRKIACSIDLSLCAQFGFFCLAAGIGRRLGLDYKGRGRFLTGKVGINGFNDRHVAEYYLSVLDLLGVRTVKNRRMEIYADRESETWARSLAERRLPAGKPVVGIAPCGGEAFGKDAPVKRWPWEKYARLIDRLVKEKDAFILIFAGKDERETVNSILGRVAAPDRCLEFTDEPINRIVALVGLCRLFIGNDTGPLRFADAQGKDLVAIFGPVDERVYGPFPPDPGRCAVVTSATAGCRPCYRQFRLSHCANDRACLTSISTEEVFEAAVRLLSS